MARINFAKILSGASGGALKGVQLQLAEKLRQEVLAQALEEEKREEARRIAEEGRAETRDIAAEGRQAERTEQEKIFKALLTAASMGSRNLKDVEGISSQPPEVQEALLTTNEEALRGKRKERTENKEEIISDISVYVSNGLAPKELLVQAQATKKLSELKKLRNAAAIAAGEKAAEQAKLQEELLQERIGATGRSNLGQADGPLSDRIRLLETRRKVAADALRRLDANPLSLDEDDARDRKYWSDILRKVEAEILRLLETQEKIISGEVSPLEGKDAALVTQGFVTEGELVKAIRLIKTSLPNATPEKIFNLIKNDPLIGDRVPSILLNNLISSELQE